MENENNLEYSIEVYKDHAIIKGWLSTDVLKLIFNLCKKEGFTHMTSNENQQGFKLVKK
jgi:hypothetical protein